MLFRSLTAWFNIPAARVGDSTAMTMVNIENATETILLYRNGLNQITIRYKQGGVTVEAVVAEPGTGWYFVAATWDTNGNLVLYLGDPGLGADDTQDLSARSPIVPTAAKIGTRADSLIQDYEGQLSDVMLWNDALSQAECEAVYDLGRNPTYAQLDGLANKAEILHWWPFTSDAEDGEIDWSTTADVDGTFVGNAYINSTSVIGLNTNDPLLVNGALTVVGAANVTGNISSQGNLALTGAANVDGELSLGDNIDLNSATGTTIASTVSDQDVAFTVNDGGTTRTLMTFDGSSGRVIFESTALSAPVFESGLYIATFASGNLIDSSSNGLDSNALYIGDEQIDTIVSDERLKTNVEPSSLDAVALLTQLNLIDFDWSEPTKREGRMTGLSAQELYQLYPQYVRKGPVHTDPNGVLVESNWAIRYNMMVPVLIKAVLELKAESIELDKRIRALETTR